MLDRTCRAPDSRWVGVALGLIAGCSGDAAVSVTYQHQDLDGRDTRPVLVAIRPDGGDWMVERGTEEASFDVPAGGYTLAVVHECTVIPEVWTVDATTDEITELSWMPCLGVPPLATDLGGYYNSVALDPDQRLDLTFGVQSDTLAPPSSDQASFAAGTHDVVMARHRDGEEPDRIAIHRDVTVIAGEVSVELFDFEQRSVEPTYKAAAVDLPDPFTLEALWLSPTTVGRITNGTLASSWAALPADALASTDLQAAHVASRVFTSDTVQSIDIVEFMREPVDLDHRATAFQPAQPLASSDDGVLATLDLLTADPPDAWCLTIDAGTAYWTAVVTPGAARTPSAFAISSLRDLPGWEDSWSAPINDGWSNVTLAALHGTDGIASMIGGVPPVPGETWIERSRTWRGQSTLIADPRCLRVRPQ